MEVGKIVDSIENSGSKEDEFPLPCTAVEFFMALPGECVLGNAIQLWDWVYWLLLRKKTYAFWVKLVCFSIHCIGNECCGEAASSCLFNYSL